MNTTRKIEYVAKNLRYLRRIILQVSQEVFSELTGVSKDTVSNLERGKYLPSITSLVRIANALKCPLDFFFSPPEDESAFCIYRVCETFIYDSCGEERELYGVEAVLPNGDILRAFPDVFCDRATAESFVARINKHGLSLLHFKDAVEDAVTAEQLPD